MSVRTNVIPKWCFIRAKYIDQTTLASAMSPYSSSYKWQSSYYDPNLSGVGHQPYLRDTYATLYSYYRVWGVHYSIRFVNLGTAPARVGLGILGYVDSLASLNMNLDLERPYTRHRAVLDTKDNTAITFKGYASVPRVEGISPSEFTGDAAYECAIGASPTKCIQIVPMADSSTTTSVQVFVTLQLVVELWGRPPQAES